MILKASHAFGPPTFEPLHLKHHHQYIRPRMVCPTSTPIFWLHSFGRRPTFAQQQHLKKTRPHSKPQTGCFPTLWLLTCSDMVQFHTCPLVFDQVLHLRVTLNWMCSCVTLTRWGWGRRPGVWVVRIHHKNSLFKLHEAHNLSHCLQAQYDPI